MKRERACMACDGAGYEILEQTLTYYTYADCPACFGTGRVTDHIPAVDAVADAETLLRAAAMLPEAWGFQRPGAHGVIVASDLRRNYLSRAASLAAQAARAAFRAVPGLREGN